MGGGGIRCYRLFCCMSRILLLIVALATTSWVAADLEIARLGPYGGDVRSLAVHPARPDTYFLGTADGQIYISRDTGDSWTRLVPGLRRRDLVVDNLAFHPKSPDVLYAATWELKSNQGRLFKTEDAGVSWEELSLGNYQSSIRAVAIAPSEPEVLAVGMTEGVVLSVDGGRTWERISRGYRSMHNVNSLAFDPTDSHTLYVGTWHLGFRTSDRGKKWEPMHAGMIDDSDMFSLLVHPKKPEILYSSACTGVYRSNNRGTLWIRQRNGFPREAIRTRSLHLDPMNHDILYAGTTVGLYVSYDGSDSWRLLKKDIVVNAISVNPADHRILLVGTDDAGVIKSTDSGQTFRQVNTGFIHRQVAALAASAAHPGTYYAAVPKDRQFGGFFVSRDMGQTWDSHNDGLGSAVSEVRTILLDSRSDRIYLGTSRGLYQGIPGESPWQLLEATRNLSISGIAEIEGEALLLATSSGIFRLEQRTNRLKRLIIPIYQGKINTVVYEPDSRRILAGGDTGVFRSEDGGNTWTIKVKGLPYTPIHVLERNGERLFAGTRHGVFYSDNDGDTWSSSQGIYSLDVQAIKPNPHDSQEVFAADLLAGYLFRSRDGGANWTVYDTGTSRSRIAALVFASSGDLLAGTLSDGVYRIDRLDAPTGSR
jgi:photosystem II stability/assembly factor-like uncharacterized protein